MKRIAGLTFLTVSCALLTGCATKMTVMAGLSENIKEYYSIYPSVEIDIAAVTEDEAEDLKKLNADAYFAVGNPARESLTPYTFLFSAEQTAPQTMKYNVPQWDKWLEKDPKKIAVLANMPRKTEDNGKGGKDPRIMILDMSSGFMHHKKLFVEAKPGSVVRLSNEPTDPEVRRKENEKLRKEKEEKAAREKKEAQKKAAREKREAEKNATKDRREAQKKVGEEKKAVDRKALEDKRAAENKAAREKRLADRDAARERRAAERKAARQRRAAEKQRISKE